jgi:hypothetical protein
MVDKEIIKPCAPIGHFGRLFEIVSQLFHLAGEVMLPVEDVRQDHLRFRLAPTMLKSF